MMFHQSFSQNSRRSKGIKARRIILFSALLGVVLWLSYQVKHSYDTKHEYYRNTEAKNDNGHPELYLGRKFYPGLSEGIWDGKTSMSKEDASDEDSQSQTEQVENESLEKEEESHEGTENSEEAENQQSEITALENDVDMQLTNGDRYMENGEAQNLGESSEKTSETDNTPEQIESSGDAAFQAIGSEDTNDRSEDGSEILKEVVLGNQDENSEGITRHESSEVENLSTDGNSGLSLDQANDEENGRIAVTLMEKIRMEEASQEKSEMGKDTNRAEDEKGVPDSQGRQSEEESVPTFQSQNELVEVAPILETESVERSSDSSLFEKEENSAPFEGEATGKEWVESEGHGESEATEGVTAAKESVSNNAEINSETSSSSGDRENPMEISINHENPTAEATVIQGDLSSLSDENIIGITESKKWENNLLMVTDNAASNMEEVVGVLDLKTVENILDHGGSGPNNIDGIITKRVNPSNENAQAEHKVQNDGTSGSSISPVVFSDETNTGQGKEEF